MARCVPALRPLYAHRMLFSGFGVNLLLSLVSPAIGQNSNETDLGAPVAKLHAAAKSSNADPTVENQIREATWRLLVGEIASQPENGLTSGTVDALSRGLTDLDSILETLQKQPDLERRISRDATLAMRLDVTKARLTQLSNLLELSRAEEVQRLAQLRQLNRSYRDLLQHILSQHTEAIVGNADGALRDGEKAAADLDVIDKIAAQRRDFYLFQDEPLLDGSDSELKQVRQIALPYADDVRRHHRTMLSLILFRLATQQIPTNENLLTAAEQQVNAAIVGAETPDTLALYASSLVSIERGMLVTLNQPYSKQAHSLAAPHFEKALTTLERVSQAIAKSDPNSGISTNVSQLLQESRSPEHFMKISADLQRDGRTKEAIEYLQRGVARHRDAGLAMNLIEQQWRQKAKAFPEIEKALSDMVREELFDQSDSVLLLSRSRILIGEGWRTLVSAGDEPLTKEARLTVLGQMNAGLTDCRKLFEQVNPQEVNKWQAKALESLATATIVLLDDSADLPIANEILQGLPLVATQLESLAGQAEPIQKELLFESLKTARLAEGYLITRLLPDYKDRATAAFTAALNAHASSNQSDAVPLGSAVMSAVLARDDAEAQRLLDEERRLRLILQRAMPALAATTFSPPSSVSEALEVAYADSTSASTAWNPQQHLDPSDTDGARESVKRDMRASAVLSLLRAQQANKALELMLASVGHPIDVGSITRSAWDEIVIKATRLTDPFELFAFGRATEEVAVTSFVETSPFRQILLRDALRSYQRSLSLWNESEAWKERWPYLGAQLDSSIRGLLDPSAALEEAESLRVQLRISEARKVLVQAQRRHTNSTQLRDQLVQTLLDEAEIRISDQSALLEEAKQLLIPQGKTVTDLSSNDLLLLGQLMERLNQTHDAINAYELVRTKSTDAVEQVKSAARLAVLTTRQAP